MPTPCRNKTPAKKQAPAKPSRKSKLGVEDLTEDMSALALTLKLDHGFKFPTYPYSYREGNKQVIKVDTFAMCNGPESLVHAKVLPGGRRLSWLFGSPRWFAEADTLRRQMGNDYHEDHVQVQARLSQVTYPVARSQNARKTLMEGEAQIVELPFKCIEGDIRPKWGQWDKMGQRINRHKKFLISMTLKVTSEYSYVTNVTEEDDEFEIFEDYPDDEEDENHAMN